MAAKRDGRDDRAERLAAALRDNLKKRKARQRDVTRPIAADDPTD